DPHHYLFRVLRLRPGDALEVFDGRGNAFDAKVEAVGALSLGPARAVPAPRRIAVVQGLPKADKLEWVLQKATELGATSFHPAECARSVAKAARADAKVARWKKIAEEAARQSGRADVPEVHPPLP